jgi:4-amino-4-deoxy-L-arabinose transferase-like glycosyltransferase
MIKKENIFNILIVFLLVHLLIWTLIPTFSNLNLPLDTIEALAWGSNLDWGFNKHPPLSAFVVNFFYQVFGNQDWVYYLLSQVFVVIAFFTVYKFSEEFFKSKIFALISVLLLEGIYFYNFTSPEFNVNVCQLPFWALSVYFTWRCIKHDQMKDYVFLGIFIGLGVLSKYLFIYLVIGIKLLFIYLLYKKKKLKYKNFLISGTVCLLILLPHLIWLTENNYTTIVYGFERTGGIGNFLDHLIYPVIFLGKQIGIIAPLVFMGIFLIKRFKINLNFKDEKLIFLFFTTIFPIILIFFTSMIMGVKIRTMWMTPFYLFFGVLLIYIFQKNILYYNFKKFLFIFLFFLILSPVIYLNIAITNDTKRTDYPGKEIARLVQNKWNQNYRNEISFVIGDEWYAGNLSYHLRSRPTWVESLEDKISEIGVNQGVIYVGNPKVLKRLCPGTFGKIRPVGYCMIGQK